MNNTIVRLVEIFNTNKWFDLLGEHIFKKFVIFLTDFSEEERSMIMDLFSRFTVITSAEYSELIAKTINKIDDELINHVNKLYVMPLKSPIDSIRTKSSSHVAYLFEDDLLLKDTKLEKKDIYVADILDQIPNKINDMPKRMIILVDDFIGTGETAESCCENLITNGISKSKIIILTIAGMSEGLNRIKKMGIQIFAEIVENKGISDLKDETLKKDYINCMEKIEKNANVPESYNFGYGRSEALFKLIRVPNNTFPVFWHDSFKKKIFQR